MTLDPPFTPDGKLSPKVAYAVIGVSVGAYLAFVGYSIVASKRTNAEILRRFDENMQGFILRMERDLTSDIKGVPEPAMPAREDVPVDGGEAASE